MVRRSGACVLLLLTGSLALTGCTSDPPKAAVAVPELPPNYELADEGVTDDLGGIHGYVVDDEHLPLAKALVGFVEPYIADVTDGTGYFEIGQLAPGKWTLYVVHLGHKADGLIVNVRPGEFSKVTFVLPVLPVEEPWYDVIPFEGRISYAAQYGGLGYECCSNEKTGAFATKDKTSALTTIVFGLDWVASHNMQSGLRLDASVQKRNRKPP